jgi:putative ABC transport system permease protein
MMFGYYLDLALRSFKRNKILTALMVVAIALGIGASMTTLTVLHVLSGDPVPGRSSHIYYPQVDPRDMRGYQANGEPADQMAWIDGMNLLRAHRADRQALMTGGAVPIQPTDANIDPFYVDARYTTADFFPMFDVPFEYGASWSAKDDGDGARVAVISRDLNDKLFGGNDSVGRTLRINDADMRIVGVLDAWRPNPHFYDLYQGTYGENEGVFVPLSVMQDLKLDHLGSTDCWGKGPGLQEDMKTASCTWLQLWVELDTPAKAAAYKQFLLNYARTQHAQGRFQRPPNVRLRDVMQWLEFRQVVPGDVRLQVWLAFGFLLVCLVNTVGLMLAKFLRRSGEIGVRRALGAARRAVFAQLLVEAGIVGLAGGVFGFLLALAGLWVVRRQPADYAKLAHLDPAMLLVTFALAVGASLLAGLLPAWRACRIAPALQLKGD